MTPDAAFTDWKLRAQEADILEEARRAGAQLRRAGSEWIGPCCACGGTDRFSIHPGKRVFNCRGFGGGGVIDMTMHLHGCDFLKACEILTGEPPPRGQGRDISPEEKAARDSRRADAERKAAREAEDATRKAARRRGSARGVWCESLPLPGSIAESYLIGRGVPKPPMGWPDVLRFHPDLDYELDRSAARMPALLAKVQGLDGKGSAVWQIYLDPKGGKAKVENPKVGRGPAGGGAVRIGGIASHIGVAEGVETALAAWTLEGYRIPVWATLSTSGMQGFEPPPEIARVTIFPDGDRPKERPDGKIMDPPGMKAALALRDRLAAAGIRASITPPPLGKGDFLDVLNKVRSREAV